MWVNVATFEDEARSRLLVFPTMPIVVFPSKRRRLDGNRDGGILPPNFARSGPIDLPGTGYGSIRKEDRDVIKQLTGCSAAIRRRPSWNARKLTISGPRDQMRAAELAHRRGAMLNSSHCMSQGFSLTHLTKLTMTSGTKLTMTTLARTR